MNRQPPTSTSQPQQSAQPQPQQQQQQTTLISTTRLRELLSSIAEGETMDPLVITALLRMADEFAVDVCRAAIELSAHRRSEILMPRDVQHVLKNEYGIDVCGFEGAEGDAGDGAATGNAPKRKSARTAAGESDVHASRMSKIRQVHSRY